MKVKTINKFKIELPKKSAFTIDTDDDFPKLHTLTIASGKRGGGKSVQISNLIKKAKEKGYYDKCWLITPTYNSNKQIWDIADIDENDVMEPTHTCLKELIKLVESEKQEWEDFLARKKLYAKYKKEIEDKPIQNFKEQDLVSYLDNGFFNGAPDKWKYKTEQPPRLAVIIDDCLGTELMARRTAGLTNLCIRHRHIADGLGISIFMLVQSYCCHDGVPPAVRQNTTNLLLFKINDDKQIKKVKEECDLPVTDDEWETMTTYAHEKPFNFLFIDFNPKCEQKRFRSGMDEYIVPDSLKCKCNK